MPLASDTFIDPRLVLSKITRLDDKDNKFKETICLHKTRNGPFV